MASIPPAKKLAALDIGVCYHCNTRSNRNVFCELWNVWCCDPCLQRLHRTHHQTCDVDATATKGPAQRHEARYFTLWVTRYDGRKLPLTCRLGDKLEMEDHWLGTYIFARGGMLLVTEDRATINEKLLLGLKAAK
ncbi:MAG: hypothetical protein NTZ90_16875 [Proteobacteria bacterium]|nr:hypothetical protein [Pseudomonadota bacterium]